MVESWAARLAPEPFRDFLPYASASALKVIHAKQVLGKALAVAQHVNDAKARAQQSHLLAESLAAAGLAGHVGIASEPGAGLRAIHLTESERRALGGRVLALYFHLMNWGGPLFLDLRPRHLSWDSEQQKLSFYPSSLWYAPGADFMQRVRALYAGFYRKDAVAMAHGVDLYRWASTPTPGFAERMERLLRAHFGSTGETRFSIAHFRATFDAVFDEVAASHAKLHPELTFLGVELVGLYLTLESLNVPLDAKAAFDRVTQ